VHSAINEKQCSGGVGGVACILVGHPFDLLKVRMQTGTSNAGSNAGVFGSLTHTLKREGVRGLYRGVSAPLLASSPVYALSFWGYDVGQKIVRKIDNKEDTSKPLSIAEIMTAGGLSALPMMVVIVPTERIKCLLQIQTMNSTKSNTTTIGSENVQRPQPPRYNGMIDCATKIYKSGGVTSLYKGTMITLLRDVPGSIAWFGTYEIVKRNLVSLQGIDDPSRLSPLAVMTAGGFAGIMCWVTAIAPDTLKSRYQTAPDGKYPGGMIDVYRTLVKEEGHSALFTGIRPALIRAFPANAACFLGMEVAKKLLAYLD